MLAPAPMQNTAFIKKFLRFDVRLRDACRTSFVYPKIIDITDDE